MTSRANLGTTAIEVYLCKVTPGSVSAARAYVSPAETLRAAQYRRAVDCACSILAHGLKRRQLSRATGVGADQLRLAVLPQGKPVLEIPAAISFSLAHSGAWVAFALSRQGDVGIDIEPGDRTFDHRLYAHALNDSERCAIDAANDTALAFVICWTQKESVLKALGEPMAYQPKRVCGTPRLGTSSATCGSKKVHVFSMIERGCVISIASTRRFGTVRVTELEPWGLNNWREHLRRNMSEVRSSTRKKTPRIG
jgi:4'-phosphopantetheinyl transferase